MTDTDKIIAHWQKVRSKIRVISDSRKKAIERALKHFTAKECIAAITAYSQNKWNIQNNQWLDIADFFKRGDCKVLAKWVEFCEVSDHQKRKKQRPGPAVASFVDDVADSMCLKKMQEQKDCDDLAALAKSENFAAVVDQAISEISWPDFVKATHRRNGSGLNNVIIRKQVLVILARVKG